MFQKDHKQGGACSATRKCLNTCFSLTFKQPRSSALVPDKLLIYSSLNAMTQRRERMSSSTKKIRFSVSSAIRMLWRGPSLATLSAAQRQVRSFSIHDISEPETGQDDLLPKTRCMVI